MQPNRENFDSWTKELSTKSDKIRELARHGVATGDIARFLDIRFQHVRNVLMKSGLYPPTARGRQTPPTTTSAAGAADHAWGEIREDGSLVLPTALLAAAGLKAGDRVHLRMGEDGLEVLSRKAALDRAYRIVAKYAPPGASLADELIADRRSEAARDERPMSGGERS